VSNSPRDPRLFDLFAGAIGRGLKYVRLAETGKTYIRKYDNWPELKWHDNGLPWITTKSFDAPKDYSEAIRGIYSLLSALGTGEPPLDFTKEPEFLALLEYARTHSRLTRYLIFEQPSDFGSIRLLGLVADSLNRYIHINNTIELDRDQLLPVYLPIEKWLFGEELPADVLVPILFLKFDDPVFRINEFMSVKELTQDLHLARAWRGPMSDSTISLVEGAATHALFISNRLLENRTDWLAFSRAITQPESYPVELIDTFFAALRISTGYATGFAQLLTLPLGWASRYNADLTPLHTSRMNRYPPFFENAYWLEEVPTVNSRTAGEIAQTFENLQEILATKHKGRVRLAIDRLNLSSMRTTDEDGILDTMIALEALLSDGRQEMTHKVSMRLAGLYKIADPARAEQVFREMKLIYAFRSMIVHGEADLDKHRIIDRDGGKVFAVDAAAEHLRATFAAIIKNPILLEPKKIDSFLLNDKY